MREASGKIANGDAVTIVPADAEGVDLKTGVQKHWPSAAHCARLFALRQYCTNYLQPPLS